MLGRRTLNIDVNWWTRRFIRNVVSNATRTVVQGARAARLPLDEAPLFVADTRPAMSIFSVPHSMAVLLIFAYGESLVFLGPLWAFWVLIPWVAAMQAVRKDYNAPRIILLWAQSKMMAFEAFVWDGASPSPFPRNPGRYPRGIWR